MVGSCWSTSLVFRTLRFLFLAAVAAGGISASAAELTVLVDQDLNPASGCTVTTASGPFTGVEQRFVTTIDTSVNPPMVTGVTQSTCTNPSTNTFGPVTSVSAGGWSVGVGNGVGGYNVIEAGLPLPAGVTSVRLAYLYNDGIVGADTLTAQVNGTGIVVGAPAATSATAIPTLSPLAMAVLLLLIGGVAFLVLRHGGAKGAGTVAIVLLAFIATIASAAIVLDGLTADWAGTAPVNDAIGDAAAGADISAAFARIEGSTLFVRVDVKTTLPPSAVADALTADAGTTLTVAAATGLLSNDTLGTPAATIASYGGGSLGGAATDHVAGSTTVVGTGGSLVVQADGSLSFTPPTGFSSSFTFNYRLANAFGFSVGTVTIAARVPPTITSAASTTFVLGNASSFSVTATGSPNPTLALTGALPSGITFNAATGVLSGTPGAGTSGTYPLTFTASNGVNPNAVQSFTLTVSQGAAITSANATTFTVGTAGTFTVTTSASPTASTISISGALPAGVTFTNNGNGTATLAGTPGAATGGTYPFTITATNGVGAPGTQSFTLTVNQAPAITSGNASTFTVGNSGSFTVTATGFPSPTLSLGGPLPSGVTFNAATGVLSGTPAAGTAGAYPLTITASNGVGANATQSFTLTVNQGVLITSANAATFTVGTAGTFSITTSGAPVAATISETGALPSGLLFVNNGNGTATLSGTPGAGTGGVYPITITASNGVGSPGTQSVTITVLQAPAIVSGNTTTFRVGSGSAFPLSSSGYPASAFTETGALPTGVTFTSNGDGTATLAGTPASGTGGTYPLSISASNGVGSAAVQAFTLTVQEAPVAVTDAYTVAHDTVLPGASVLANDTGVPAPALASVTGNGPACTVFPCAITTTHGSATVNADGTFTYTPAAAFAGSDGFAYGITNAAGTSSSTATITVTDVTPIADLNGAAVPGIDFGPATFVEAAGPVAIVDPAQLTVTDADSATLASATVVLTNALDGTSESINLTCPDVAPGCSGAILRADVVSTTAVGPPATATITILRVAPLADYQALLRTLTYSNAATNPSNTDRDITITVNDGIGDNAPVAHTTVVVNGVNDAPTITAPASVTTPVNTPYAFSGSVSVADPDAGASNVRVDVTATNGTLTLSGAAGLTITGNGTGSVSATGPLSSQNSALAGMQYTPNAGFNGAASVGITIDDLGNTGSGGPKNATRSIAVAVNQAPTITSASAATFVVGTAGTFTVTTSAVPTVTAISETGALPSGLTFTDLGNGTATITGTANAGTGGSYPLTINAVNGVVPNASQSFTLTVNEAPAITSANTTTFSVGAAGTFTVATTGFPNATLSITAGTLPSGVTLNATTGVLSGTPAVGTGGTYPVTVTATNGVSPAASQSFSLVVREAPTITSSSSATFTTGAAGSFSITTSATPTVSVITLTGTLPSGVSFVDNGNGTASLSGTPGAGTGGIYPVTISASNGVLPNASQSLTVTVLQAPAFTSANTTMFSIGTAGTFTVSTTGFPLVAIGRTGTLPSGVSFTDNGNGTGTLAGTPATGTEVGSPYAEVFTATNTAGSVPQSFSLKICPVIGATPVSLAQPTRTNLYTTTLGGSGGTAPYTFTVASGALPTGLTLASNGVLSGTESGAGTFNFSVGLTDANGCTGSTAYSVLVNEPPVAGTDNYDAVGNTLLEVTAAPSAATPKISVSGNVLANDNDGNGGANGAGVSVVSVGTFATANGGSITLAADGTFTYLPPAGFAGADSATYTVSDGIGTGPGTINFNVVQRVWYVQNNAAPGGNGTSTKPFDTLAAAVAASQLNDTIYVFTGSGTSANQDAGAVLKGNQRLIGQGSALDVIGTVNGVVNPVLQAAGSAPVIGNAGGNGVTLASSNTVKGLNIANGSSGAGLFGSNVGSLVVSGVNITAGGTGVDLTGIGAPAVNVVLGTLNSSGGTNNVNLAGLGGTVTLGSGALSGATSHAFAVNGGSANVNYAGTITNASTNARVVSVTNETGGTIALSGAVTSSGVSPAGVFLNANTGATIAFSGGLNLSTGINPAFTATNGGTVTAVQNNVGIVNTLSSATGSALNVASTTIGAAGLTFRSITSSGGTAAGIILDTTGATGGLTVTGDGSNTALGGNGSGGTIANKSGSNLANGQGTGIYLNNTRNVVLRRMTINGTNANYGIHGYNVNGFTLEYSTVSGLEGDTASLAFPENYGEGAIYFGNASTTGLVGAGTFTSNVVSGGRARNLSIVDSAGSATLTIKGNQFGQVQNFSNAAENVAVEARGSASVTATLGDTLGGGNTIAGSPGDQVNFTGQTATTLGVTLAGNTLTNTHPQNLIGGSSVTLATQGTMNFTMQNNTMTGANGSAVTLQLGSAGTLLSGKLDNNTIGTNGLVDSGSKTGNGIFGSFAGAGTAALTITNNRVFNYSGLAGMFFDNTGGSYAANFTIVGNTMSSPTPNPNVFAGLVITNGGAASTDTVNVCANIRSNDFSTADPANANDITIGASGTPGGHTFNLPGYVGTTLGQVQSFILGNNLQPGTTAVTPYTDPPVTATAFTGIGTTCPTPP